MIDLRLGDCLDFLKSMPDKSIDVIVTDPPYGIGESGRKNSSRSNLARVKEYGNYNWDSKPISPEAIKEILRVSKEQVIFGGNYYAHLLPPSASWIVWDKLNSGDFADCELAWTSHKKAVRKFTYMWNGFIKQQPEERYHETQKPLSLMEWVILNYTKPGDLVCDPYFGSGTTAVACAKLGRRFVGTEISPHHVETAKMRIKQAQAQPALFVEAV